MNQCFCNRLYNLRVPSTIAEYAFSGSLCCIRKFEIADGLRYCLTIFSLCDYKHLHFPHDEYKLLIAKLNALLSTRAIMPTTAQVNNSNDQKSFLSIRQMMLAPDENLKIKFGRYSLSVGPVTAIGLVKTTPFNDLDVFSANKKCQFTCDSKWDICTCKTCAVFTRLIDYEKSARRLLAHRKSKNVIYFPNIE